MSSKRIKVSFEITDNYDIAGFRNFVRALLSDEETFDVYIISNDDSSTAIATIGAALNLDSDHIVICNFEGDKVTAVTSNSIDIHLDNLQSTVLLVEETTEAYGILVNPNINRATMQPDYVTVFDRRVHQIRKDRGEA
jgi:NADH/NAD ratio-sensing transcriptional regulator Rex